MYFILELYLYFIFNKLIHPHKDKLACADHKSNIVIVAMCRKGQDYILRVDKQINNNQPDCSPTAGAGL